MTWPAASALLVGVPSLGLLLGTVGTASDEPLYPNQTENAAELRSEIESRCDEWMDAMLVNDDLDEVASFYADNALIVGERRMYVSGRESIDAYWTRIPTASDWKLTTYFVDGSSSLIIQRGRSDLTFSFNEQEQVSSVEFLHIWQRQADNSLKIVVDSYWQLPG